MICRQAVRLIRHRCCNNVPLCHLHCAIKDRPTPLLEAVPAAAHGGVSVRQL
jgi:hypothetical protein